jgi:MFS family permease
VTVPRPTPSTSTPAREEPLSRGTPVESAWSPLAESVFRALWVAALVSNVGTWMQNVAGAWLMTSLTTSPLPVALMQSAVSLPVFLLGLPAGALADLVDRRKLLLAAQAWMLVAATLLGVLTLAELTTPVVLLALTFALGLGGAINGPAWQATTPEIVSRPRLHAAITLNGAGFNLARAIGPALGGLVVAAIGPGFAFLLNALSFLATIVALYSWRRTRTASTAPPEDLLGAMRAGLRYTRFSPALTAVLVRVTVFAVFASALWALLPLVARYELQAGSGGYGLLLAGLGIGAVVGAFALPRLRARFSADQLIAAGTVLFAAMTAVLGFVPDLWVAVAAMFLAGLAWMAIMSSFNVAAQTFVPRWVQARAVGTYLLVFMGAMAVGSAVWGAVAERLGDPTALGIAALGLLLTLGAGLRWQLRAGEGLDLQPAGTPMPQFDREPDPEEGPVLVSVEYRVDPSREEEFARVMQDVGRLRRRDGALRWRLYRDPAVPDRYVETFLVGSWAEHQRQHERSTMTDRALTERARSFLVGQDAPIVSHLVAVRPPRGHDDEAG